MQGYAEPLAIHVYAGCVRIVLVLLCAGAK